MGLALLALCVAAASAQTSGPAPAEVDALFARHDQATTPGCALGVYRDGEMAYARGYGMADLGHGVPISPTTVFYIGSTAKQFTAFAVAVLSERGALSLADPIRKHVPELPDWADPVTLEHLVHHTSGLRDYLLLWGLSGRSFADAIPLEQAIELISRQSGLDFEPGTAWAYSNSGYLLLAEIVARVAGVSLREFMEREAFAPLGMTSTLFYDDAGEIVANRANGYQPDGDGGFQLSRSSFALVGDGGLLATVADLLKWDENFYRSEPVGGRPVIERLTQPGTLETGESVAYAFGLTPGMYRGLPTLQHGGGFIGFRAQLLKFPTEHFSVAVLCNDAGANPEALALQVADLYLASRLDLDTASAATLEATSASALRANRSAADLERFVGRYAPQAGLVVEVVLLGDALALQTPGGASPLPLEATSPDTFSTPVLPGAVRFSFDEQGEPALLLDALGQVRPALRLQELPPLSRDDLAAFVGRYTSTEIDSWFELRAGDGLALRRRYQAWEALEPVAPDHFIGPNIEVRFGRDDEGSVTGLTAGAGRVEGIVFTKDR